MKGEEIKIFLNRKILISRKSNGYKHVGTLQKVSNDSILLVDRYDGPTIINIDDIGMMREANPND